MLLNLNTGGKHLYSAFCSIVRSWQPWIKPSLSQKEKLLHNYFLNLQS